jgi:endogenous inhibitor of DNA gyrase (YacG/DUF329 family)
MTCPICKKAAAAAYTPFCSRRCADIDLGRWLTGSYAIPSSREEDLDPEPEPSPTDGDGRAESQGAKGKTRPN